MHLQFIRVDIEIVIVAQGRVLRKHWLKFPPYQKTKELFGNLPGKGRCLQATTTRSIHKLLVDMAR